MVEVFKAIIGSYRYENYNGHKWFCGKRKFFKLLFKKKDFIELKKIKTGTNNSPGAQYIHPGGYTP
ncbi:hypothetical protein BH11BAC3_BH11BAC3_02940 [soil metagenome]